MELTKRPNPIFSEVLHRKTVSGKKDPIIELLGERSKMPRRRDEKRETGRLPPEARREKGPIFQNEAG